MPSDFDLVRLFSLVITNSHISNNEKEKKCCIYFNEINYLITAVNDEESTCYENLFINNKEKRDYIITNSIPDFKDILILKNMKIKKLFIIAPENKEDINSFLENKPYIPFEYEFFCLEDKRQLIKNIEKDDLINFKDSYK